jgi:serine O-acetyltransferase
MTDNAFPDLLIEHETIVLASLGKPHTRGCAKSYEDLKEWLSADLYRYSGDTSTKSFFKHFLFTPGYKYTVWMRATGYLKCKAWAKFPIYPFFKWMLLRCRYKYGIAIPEYTQVGPGLFINRFGGVMVNGDAIIGANCNLTHGCMLGQLNRGPRMGSPILGDRVFLASGAKVVGHIKLGNCSVVGANAVVTKDVPDNGVVGGIPAKIISEIGSEGYINRTWPPEGNA